MKHLFLSLLIAFLLVTNIQSVYSQANGNNNPQEKYSLVRIFAKNPVDFMRIQNAGLFLDEGTSKPGYYFETYLSESEKKLLDKSGVSYQVIIEDWLAYYLSQPKMTSADMMQQMKESKEKYNVTHSIYGTMGGHLKWQEMINKIDSLRIEFPTLVSVKYSIGNSYENRPLWTVRITKGPDSPTGRPEIWLNGVTHAREPIGTSNILYFIYWLVENYNIDPIATYILNNREIYYTPFINPDGYIYNETTNPTGGGNWRKNRKPQGTSIGTDLNRNFGTYNFWNSSNGGSSTTPSSDTYRGPYPFSEPETQNFKNFVNSRNFKVQLDYHTYGNLLIKPWAWCDPTPTPDDAIFNQFGNDIVSENHFTFGTPFQTVGYYVRGGDLDWVYSNDSTGHPNHIFGFTPEVGPSFWPTQTQIMGLVQSCLEMNKYMCLVAGPYASVNSNTLNKQTYVQNETGNLKVVFKNKGLGAAQNIKVEFTPITNYFTVPVQLYTKASLASFASDSVTFNFTIANNCPNNAALTARLRVKQNDSIVMYDKNINIFVGTGNTVLLDSAENGTVNWPTMTNWSIVTTKYLSPTHSFNGICTNYGVNQMVSIPLSVASYPAVYLSWYQKFALETGYDYGFVDVSTNSGTTWARIATFNGLDSATWKLQSFNLTPFVSGAANLLIRFRDSCDSNTNWAGWFVDNIKLTAYQPSPITGIGSEAEKPETFTLLQNYPNPFNPTTNISFAIAKSGFVNLKVYNILGEEIATIVSEYKSPGKYSVIYDAASLSSGVYFYKLVSGDFTDIKKMILMK